MPPHGGQIIQTNSIAKATESFDVDGELSQPAQFSKHEAAVFWEHGLSTNYTLTLAASYQDLNFRAGVDDVNFSGFGETNISIRRTAWRDNTRIFSTQTGVIFAGQGETITDADLGTGKTQYEARLLAGQSFKIANRDGFVDVQAAWRHRTGTPPDEWRLDISTGWHPTPKFQALAQGFYVKSQNAPGLARATERLKIQTSLVYNRTPRTSYQIGSYRTVLGRNIVQENALFIAVWQKY